MSKKALIITDGSKFISSIALLVKDALTDLHGKGKLKIIISPALKFDGTDLLASDIFFIGCENPSPPSFDYLEDMLSHINLASRKCGIFSAEENSINYLCAILKDCEADIHASPLTDLRKDNNSEVKQSAINNWIKTFIEGL